MLNPGYVYRERGPFGPMVYRDDKPWLDAIREAMEAYARRIGGRPTTVLCRPSELDAIREAGHRFKVPFEADATVLTGHLWAVGAAKEKRF